MPDNVCSPGQIAISKLCGNVMQLALKVMSNEVMPVVSPILTLLIGCPGGWPLIYFDRSVAMCNNPLVPIGTDMKCTYGLAHISNQQHISTKVRLIGTLLVIY